MTINEILTICCLTLFINGCGACFLFTCRMLMLRNSYPYTISRIFSSPLIIRLTSPSTTSSPRRPDYGTNPHSSPMSHPLRWNPVPHLDTSSLFHLSCPDPFRSSTDPSVRWSPFHILYAFRFRFRSCSASATQHRLSVPFPFSTLYDSLVSFLIGSALW